MGRRGLYIRSGGVCFSGIKGSLSSLARALHCLRADQRAGFKEELCSRMSYCGRVSVTRSSVTLFHTTSLKAMCTQAKASGWCQTCCNLLCCSFSKDRKQKPQRKEIFLNNRCQIGYLTRNCIFNFSHSQETWRNSFRF